MYSNQLSQFIAVNKNLDIKVFKEVNLKAFAYENIFELNLIFNTQCSAHTGRHWSGITTSQMN